MRRDAIRWSKGFGEDDLKNWYGAVHDMSTVLAVRSQEKTNFI